MGTARTKDPGFTLVELLVVVALIATVTAIAVPGVARVRMAGNEATALGSLRAINAAQSTFASGCGANGYAQTLADLARPPIGATAGFISPDLSRNGIRKDGFIVNVHPDTSAVVVTLASKTCNGSAADAMSVYFAEAHPIAIGVSGQRSFATDTRAFIYYNNLGATMEPGMAEATVLP